MAIDPKDGLHYVGVEKILFDSDSYGQKQVGENWCWAACIQMLFNFYGLEINQHAIVECTYGTLPNGNLPDKGADAKTITRKLNEPWQDGNGLTYTIKSQALKGAPLPLDLVNELIMKNPVIVGYHTGNSLHAVIVTAVGFEIQKSGKPLVRKIVVRDPQPPLNFPDGRIVYSARDFAERVQFTWFVRMKLG